ncbi:MAG: ABC transporter permease [Anaerolineae bacterium]|nr:ABC transporter permease [Anaerolineae bacterium]
MAALVRALNAERLKMKRSLAWWLVAIGPLAVVAMVALMYIQRPGSGMWKEYADNPWMALATTALGVWSMMFVLLFIALQTALLGNLEQRSDGWKQIFTLPNPRWATYIAKQVIVLVMIGLSTAILLAGVFGVGVLLRALNVHPEQNFAAPIDWSLLLRAGLLSYVGSWLIIAIHTWVGLRWRSFAAASVVGIVATIFAIFALNSDLGWYFPWGMPGMAGFSALDSSTDASLLPLTLALSVAGAAVVTLFGAWDVTRRDVL